MNGLYTSGGMANKNDLWKEYGYLVRREALRLQVRLPASVELDDLIQAGSIGFLNAIDNFEPKKGIALPAWITQRVRWTLIDELREQDWASRRVRSNERDVAGAIQRIEQQNGRAATESEIAAELNVSLSDYRHILAETNGSKLCSLEELQETLGDNLEQPNAQNAELDPEQLLASRSVTSQVGEEIKKLPQREQLLLSLYYQQEFNMKEVSMILGVTETRVSQLHSQVLKRLRARLLTDENASQQRPDKG